MGPGSSTAGSGLLSSLAILTTSTVRACDKWPSQHCWAWLVKSACVPSMELVRWLGSRAAGLGSRAAGTVALGGSLGRGGCHIY